MQKDLQDLQPKLIETSRETDDLIVVIEKETVEVEQVKSVVEADEAVANKAAMDAKAIKVNHMTLFQNNLYSMIFISCIHLEMTVIYYNIR